MFGQSGFSPMNGHPVRMAQASPSWWPGEATTAVRAWDTLLARTSQIPNADARGQILEWIGRSDVPGSPAERYQVITEDLRSNYVPANESEFSLLRSRLDLLQANVRELENRVRSAEQASGMPPAPAGAGSTPEHDGMMQCVAGGIALLGLIILPLVLE